MDGPERGKVVNLIERQGRREKDFQVGKQLLRLRVGLGGVWIKVVKEKEQHI